jgi:hypothetical protein
VADFNRRSFGVARNDSEWVSDEPLIGGHSAACPETSTNDHSLRLLDHAVSTPSQHRKRQLEQSCKIRPNGLVSGMRSKEFDPDDVLQEALKTFWQQGFEGTNMPELLGSMGVGRASFYNAFGSKREVFLQILDLYFETVRAHLEGLISDVRDPQVCPTTR